MSAMPIVLPSNRDENWKYANLRALARARFEPAPAPAAAQVKEIAAMLPAALPGYARLVLVDGHHVAALSTAAAGISITQEVDADEKPGADQPGADQLFANLNRRFRQGTCRIAVPANAQLALEVICVATASSHPALEISLGHGAKLQLIERQLSARSDQATLVNLHLAARVGEHAEFELARIGQHGAKAQALDTLELQLGAGAAMKCVQIIEGALASRSTAFIEHVGRDASLEWHVAALGEGIQQHDAFVHVTHAAPGARTLQCFRGIATGRSRVAFNGHMRIEVAAVGTQTDQSLKSLLAGSEAEANVRPQLEIYTDAVKASHGATVGKLDADMLFYLLSRGIPPATAESLLKWAFVSDVLAKLPSSDLRSQVAAALERQLPGAATRTLS
ncbi:MAG: SufD family Fe-S cluster assembly protein [Gammaproteobacteria bacterium]|nr:SufD family Fe-S cluster assembly protein [Gammaproteobacteria bacterium]